MGGIVPVILCGGVGSRLWPLSRKSLPKQFAQLLGEKSLFEATVERVFTELFEGPLVVTSSDHKFLSKNSYEIVAALALFYLNQTVKTPLQLCLLRRTML